MSSTGVLTYPPQTTIRPDFSVIADIIPARSKVLDLGCGTGALLAQLIQQKQVMGMGLEINPENMIHCLERGLSVCHADIDAGLPDYPDGAYDYVVMNQSLQVMQNPVAALHEMLRVGQYGIVVFPNFAYWRVRLALLFAGKMPKSSDLPFEWYNTPNIHLFTLADFRLLCQKEGIAIIREDHLLGRRWQTATWQKPFANLWASMSLLTTCRRGM